MRSAASGSVEKMAGFYNRRHGCLDTRHQSQHRPPLDVRGKFAFAMDQIAP